MDGKLEGQVKNLQQQTKVLWREKYKCWDKNNQNKTADKFDDTT